MKLESSLLPPKKLGKYRKSSGTPKVDFISIPSRNLKFTVKQKKSTDPIPYQDFAYQTGGSSLIGSHSTEYPGMKFKDLRIGDIVYARDENGKMKSYKISSTKVYRYENSRDPKSGGVIEDGHKMSWEDMSRGIQANKDSLALYASISQYKAYSNTKKLINSQRSSGLRVHIATPIADTAWPPRPRIK
jgi:hypothetical protein